MKLVKKKTLQRTPGNVWTSSFFTLNPNTQSQHPETNTYMHTHTACQHLPSLCSSHRCTSHARLAQVHACNIHVKTCPQTPILSCTGHSPAHSLRCLMLLRTSHLRLPCAFAHQLRPRLVAFRTKDSAWHLLSPYRLPSTGLSSLPGVCLLILTASYEEDAVIVLTALLQQLRPREGM